MNPAVLIDTSVWVEVSRGSGDESLRAELACHALFFSPHQAQHSPLAKRLGCRVEGSSVGCDSEGMTDVPGFFVAGNPTKGVQMAIVAAADGLVGAAAINDWLLDLDAVHPELAFSTSCKEKGKGPAGDGGSPSRHEEARRNRGFSATRTGDDIPMPRNGK